MYELIQVSEHDYYIDCPAKIGLSLINDKDVAAIDSGSDKDAGKKLLRRLEEKGWNLKVVFNTHSHADHIGGNHLLQERTGCRIYAPGLECEYTNHPELEPMTLYGGLPFKDLTGKFIMAKGSSAELLVPEVLPAGWEIIPLPGHSFDMVGFRTADENVFLADCLSSEETLEKYGIGYLWDAPKYIDTLEKVKKLTAAKFIPSHAPVTEDITKLAQTNIDAVNRLLAKILELCLEPKMFEELLSALFAVYDMDMSVQQYALIGSTVRSCLSGLYTAGELKLICVDGYMKWQSV